MENCGVLLPLLRPTLPNLIDKQVVLIYLLRVFLLVLRNFSIIVRHIELRRSFAPDNAQSFFGGLLEFLVLQLSILILRLHVQHILHVQLEWVHSARAHNARPFIELESAPSSITDDKIVNVMVCIRVSCLKGDNEKLIHERLPQIAVIFV